MNRQSSCIVHLHPALAKPNLQDPSLSNHPDMSTVSKVGHGLAKVLGIKLQYRNPTGEDSITRGESVFSVSSAGAYVEEEPTTLEWIQEHGPTRRTFINWLYGLFPFTHWIGRYNATWLVSDLVAGKSV